MDHEEITQFFLEKLNQEDKNILNKNRNWQEPIYGNNIYGLMSNFDHLNLNQFEFVDSFNDINFNWKKIDTVEKYWSFYWQHYLFNKNKNEITLKNVSRPISYFLKDKSKTSWNNVDNCPAIPRFVLTNNITEKNHIMIKPIIFNEFINDTELLYSFIPKEINGSNIWNEKIEKCMKFDKNFFYQIFNFKHI